MVLMILEVSSLADDISFMDWVSSPMMVLAFSITCPLSVVKWLAWRAFSAFCLVMEEISSKEDEVSSKAAACSAAPSANCWLEAATWVAAADTWLEASFKPSATRDMGLDMLREKYRSKAMARQQGYAAYYGNDIPDAIDRLHELGPHPE